MRAHWLHFFTFVFLIIFHHPVWGDTESLPVLGQTPSFELIDQNNNLFSSEDLRDRVWIADFIFTRCLSVCPIMSKQMARLQSLLEGSRVQLVSFSVDPSHDTPPILRDYADRYQADTNRWVFLTGERTAIWELVSGGFHLGVGEATPEEIKQGAHPILHSNRFVLVDQAGQIRGYFEGTNPDTINALADLAKEMDHRNHSS